MALSVLSRCASGLRCPRWAHMSPGWGTWAGASAVWCPQLNRGHLRPLKVRQTQGQRLSLTKILPRTKGNEQAAGWCRFFPQSDSQQTKMP